MSVDRFLANTLPHCLGTRPPHLISATLSRVIQTSGLRIMVGAALVARLTFVTKETRRLRRRDALFQLLNFELNFRVFFHVISPPSLFGIKACRKENANGDE